MKSCSKCTPCACTLHVTCLRIYICNYLFLHQPVDVGVENCVVVGLSVEFEGPSSDIDFVSSSRHQKWYIIQKSDALHLGLCYSALLHKLLQEKEQRQTTKTKSVTHARGNASNRCWNYTFPRPARISTTVQTQKDNFIMSIDAPK